MAAKKRRATKQKSKVLNKGGIRLDLEQRSFYRLSLLATQINRAVASGYVQIFQRPANGWKVVTVLGRFGPMSASQINSHTTLEMDKVTRIVDSLVGQGIATREQDPRDRRRVTVALTVKGKRVNARIEAMIARMEYEFLKALSRSERESLYEILDRLRTQADQLFSGKRRWDTVSR